MRTLTTKKGALLAALSIHLTIVVLGAARFHPPSATWFGKLQELHRGLTGVTGYNFYAPNIGRQLRDEVELKFSDGGRRLEKLEGSARTPESIVRKLDLVNGFAYGIGNPQMERSYAASWAGAVLARYPEASGVTLRLYTYDVPTMREALGGAVGKRMLLYEATFDR